LVEQFIRNEKVASSIPASGTAEVHRNKKVRCKRCFS
jgi:hypothetical protein